MDLLQRLNNWYLKHCDGDWEHGHGIKLETLDNPGWQLTVYLGGTAEQLEDREVLRTWLSDSAWIDIRIKDNCFIAAGDPKKLEFLLQQFFELFGDA